MSTSTSQLRSSQRRSCELLPQLPQLADVHKPAVATVTNVVVALAATEATVTRTVVVQSEVLAVALVAQTRRLAPQPALHQNSVADLAEAVALPNKLDLPAFNKNQYHPNLLVRFLLCKSF